MRISACFTAALAAALAFAAPAAARTAWQRPALESPTTVVADAQNRSLRLDTSRDYVVRISRRPIPGGLSIWGGHNVVIHGGHLRVRGAAGGLLLKDQTGTAWIRGLRISGRHLMEGIDLDERQPGATVVLRDILVGHVHGSYATNHADLLQTWAGPSRLLVNGFTGSSDYQGFFLLPNQFLQGPAPKLFDIRHVDLDVRRGAYALWRDGLRFPLRLKDVYVRPNPSKGGRDQWLWPEPSTGDHSWSRVKRGRPPRGSFVRATRGGARAARTSRAAHR